MATPTTITAEWLQGCIENDTAELVETLGEWCDEYPTLADELRAGGDAVALLGALDHDLGL